MAEEKPTVAQMLARIEELEDQLRRAIWLLEGLRDEAHNNELELNMFLWKNPAPPPLNPEPEVRHRKGKIVARYEEPPFTIDEE